MSQELLDRVYSPIGLSIGAITAEEIALSIVGELVKVRRRRVGSGWAHEIVATRECAMITALVLAAGESRRMGMPKPLLRFGATSFLEQIVTVLSQSNVDRVIVVLGAQAERIQALTDLSAADVVLNCDYHQGQLSSLIAGLRSVTSATDAIVLCLVDSPLITTAVVNRVIAGFRTTGRPIVVPVREGRRGHPDAVCTGRLR